MVGTRRWWREEEDPGEEPGGGQRGSGDLVAQLEKKPPNLMTEILSFYSRLDFDPYLIKSFKGDFVYRSDEQVL